MPVLLISFPLTVGRKTLRTDGIPVHSYIMKFHALLQDGAEGGISTTSSLMLMFEIEFGLSGQGNRYDRGEGI